MKTTETTLHEVQTVHGPIALVQRECELPGCRNGDGPEFTHCWTDYGVRQPFERRPFERFEEALERFGRAVETSSSLGWVR